MNAPTNGGTMKLRIALFITLILSNCCFCLAQESIVENEETAAIKEVLSKAYVKGIFVDRDIELVRSGFHPEFTMHVLNNGKIIKASLEMWLQRLELDGTKNKNRIDHQFKFIDIAKNAAIAKMEISENSKHLYTDYFCLYKFDDGWKIVSKIFASHQ